MTADAPPYNAPSTAFRRAGGALERAGAAFGGIPLPLVITAIAAFVRFWRLGSPNEIIPLDETYYAPNSFGYLCHGADMSFKPEAPQTCDGLEPAFVVHPPVAKLLTALGIKAFGYRPFGWRYAAAVVGSLSVLVIYLIGRRLWEKRWPAAAAALLVGVEGLHFVQSRIAMLDIFLSFFVLLGIWLMLEDRARAPGRSSGPRWWRIGAGVAFGLAVASKWGAVPVLPVVAAVALAWEVVRIRDARAAAAEAGSATGGGGGPGVPATTSKLSVVEGTPGPPPPTATVEESPRRRARDRVFFQVFAIAVTFVVVPAVVYLGSYGPWFLSTKRYVPPRCFETVAGEQSVAMAGLELWVCDQREILDYHRRLKSVDEQGRPVHPYMSKAWSWPWISRPAAHYYERHCVPERTKEPCAREDQLRHEEVLGLPNPLIWWVGFFIALPICIYLMITKRDDVAALLVVLFAPLVLPWFVTQRPLFMFYMTPATPFLTLMVVHLLQRWRLRRTAIAFVALSIALFGYFYPVLAAYPLPTDGISGWESRIWYGHVLRGDCTSAKIKLLCWI